MTLGRGARLVLYGVALTGPPSLYVGAYIRRLEKEYPPLPPDLTSTPALRTPDKQGRHTAYVDIYVARIPRAALLASARDVKQSAPPVDASQEPCLEELWARLFFNTKAIRWEGMAVKGGSLDPDDVGEHGFKRGQSLLGGAMRVVRAPEPGSPLMADWQMPSHIVGFFERIAAWGYPWRMMDGGRHEWCVKGMGETVEVRFAAAHDYKVVAEEGPEGKIIPRWVQRLHRAYARFLLDQAVKSIQAQAI
ncbi:hypothetical protein EIP86_002310 [Pleurotus ostreatoroseus]|nr:hypothetical protein EIP86_002310 [Pleurotus ostreatoroseus]